MIQLACPNCRAELTVADDRAGSTVPCARCQLPIPVPDTPSPDGPTLSRPDPLIDRSTTDTPNPLRFLRPAEGPDELGRLGGYRVLKILGQGGMGVVFLAEDIALKRPVALKIIRPDLANERARQRFLREAQLAAAVDHQNVVHIYSLGEDQGVPFLAMKFLIGEALDDRLVRENILPLPDVLRIGREIAAGLSAAHAKGLIHRDVKPRNIWLEGPAGHVRLLDFGLARAVQADVEMTPSGAVLGTPAYMAPEQAKGEPVDHRADLFNVGCVLYRMSTGQRPFRGNDTMSLLLALATATPTPPRNLNPNIPTGLAALITQLLEKDREKRPASAGEVVDRLAALERDPNARPLRRTHRPWLYAGIIALIAVAAATVAYFVRTKESPITPPVPAPVAEVPTKIDSEPPKKEPVPFNLSAQAECGAEQRHRVDTGATKGTLNLNYEMFALPDRMTIYYDGAKIFDSGLISGRGTIVVNYGPGKATLVEVVMNEGRDDPGTVWELSGHVIPGFHLTPRFIKEEPAKPAGKAGRKKE
jgi:serine/threonine protein kinase